MSEHWQPIMRISICERKKGSKNRFICCPIKYTLKDLKNDLKDEKRCNEMEVKMSKGSQELKEGKKVHKSN